MTGDDIIWRAGRDACSGSIYSRRKGRFFPFIAVSYSDFVNREPEEEETKIERRMGRNRSTFWDVSSIMTARENERREYPARKLVAPMIAYVDK